MRLFAGERSLSPLLRVGLLVLWGGLALTAGLMWQRMQAERRGYPAVSTDLPPVTSPWLGVNAELSQYDGSALSEALEGMRQVGFGWLRQTFPWAEIEPQAGRYDWAKWDAIVARASEHGLQIVAVLDGAPAWAQRHPSNGGSGSPPQEVADFGRFARAFAERYGAAIDHYQIWDEPNLSAHWGGAFVDPAAYVQLLREGWHQIRAVDPAAKILLAGLAPTVEGGPLNLNEAAFLEGIYAAGGGAFFDIAAAKPYGFWHRALDGRLDVNVLNFGRVALLRQVMVAHGDAGKSLWAVAWGWNALPADWAGRSSAWGSDTQESQAADTVAAIGRAHKEWPWLSVMILSHWQPAVAPDDPFLGFSLLDENGQPRPVLEAVRAWIAGPAVAWPGHYRPDHPTARYTGGWRVTPTAADIPAAARGDASEASLVIPFYGTRLDLMVRRGDFWGALFVTVDGQPANRLPRDSGGRAYLVLYDPLYQAAGVTLAAGLPDGSHQAVIVPEGGWGQWAIEGWLVGREPHLEGYPVIWVVWGLVLLVVLIVTVVGLGFEGAFWLSIGAGLVARYRAIPEAGQLAAMGLAAVTFFIAPGLLPSLAILGLLALLVCLRPDHGLAGVVFSVPFFLQPKILAGRAFSMVEIGVWLCVAAWVGRWFLAGRVIPGLRQVLGELTAADWAVTALLGVGLLSLAWAENVGVATREFRVVILESVLFYVLLRLTAHRQGSALFRLLVDALIAGAVLAAGVGLWQYFVSGQVITAEGVRRVRALYGSPNNLALFLERVLPLALALALWGPGRWRRLLCGLALLPLGAALLLTFSKGALFIALPSSLICLGLVRGRRALLLMLVSLAILAVLWLPFLGSERFAGTFDLTGGTAFFRLKLWQSSLNLIAEHPLTGVGLDNFLYAYRTRYVLPEASDELDLSHPHNILLDFWVRLGLAGVVALLGLLATFFKTGLSGRRRSSGREERVLLWGFLGSMAAALAHGLIDNAFFLVDLAFLFMLALAAVESLAGAPADRCSKETHVRSANL
ncbi:MAG: O-antigen ligase family protein [Chloroflexota bacterium]